MKNVILWSFDPFMYDNIYIIDKIKSDYWFEDITIAVWDIRSNRNPLFDINQRLDIIHSYDIPTTKIIPIKTKDDLFDILRSSNNLIKTYKDSFVKSHIINLAKDFWLSKRVAQNTKFVNISNNANVVSWKKITKSIYEWSSYKAMSEYINEYTYNAIKEKIQSPQF